MIGHFQKLSHYNKWANERLYEIVEELSEKERKQELGGFFGSLTKTLNHILVGDLLWMERIEGAGPKPASLDTILHEDFQELHATRQAVDQRLIDLMEQQTETDCSIYLDYKTSAGLSCHDLKSEIFTHMFNHQTHHRGQCHHMLTQLGKAVPPLDMIYFFRERT